MLLVSFMFVACLGIWKNIVQGESYYKSLQTIGQGKLKQFPSPIVTKGKAI